MKHLSKGQEAKFAYFTKTGLGMKATNARHKRRNGGTATGDVLTLIVRGTTDTLAQNPKQFWLKSEQIKCPCCGGTSRGRIAIRPEKREMLRCRIRNLRRKVYGTA